MKKKTIVILAAAVAVAMLALVFPLLLGGNAQYHCECGAKQYSYKNDKTPKGTSAQCAEGCSGENLYWEPLEGDVLPDEGNYYLDSDTVLTRELQWEQDDAPRVLRLDLKGHTLSLGRTGAFRMDQPESALVITDTAGSGEITTEMTDTVLHLKNGAVRHFGGILRATPNESQILPQNGSTVRMGGGEYCLSGGTIQGGRAEFGGSLYMEGAGSFQLYGGTITGGTASSGGGNVAIASNGAYFGMYGGVIEKGTVTAQGDCLGSNIMVTSGGWLYVSGGEIRGNGAAGEKQVFVNGGDTTVDVAGSAAFTGAESWLYQMGGRTNIGGGTFDGKIVQNSGNIVVLGGTFRQDVSAWVKPEATVVRDPSGIFTVNSACAATVGKVGYTLLADAVFEAVKSGGTVKLAADYTDDYPLVFPGSALVDLNGFDLNCDVQVKTGGALRIFDSQTDDFAVVTGNDRDYGMLRGKVTGELSLDHTLNGSDGSTCRYLAVTHEGTGYSFHRVELEVSSVRLVGEKSAMGIETALRCDAVVADWVTSYGISVAAADKNGVESDYGKPVAGAENKKVYQTAEILSLANSVEANNAAAKVDYTAYAYLKTAGGTVKSGEVTKSFLQVVADTNLALAGTTLTQTQKEDLGKLYRTYRGAVTAWDGEMTQIRNYADKLYQVGYAAVNIDPTPDMYGKVGLMGYDNHNTTRKVTGVDPDAPLLAICLAVTDHRGETVVLVSVDSAAVGGDVAARIMTEVHKRLDIPVGHVMLNSNHQHSTPNFSSVYDDYFVEQVVKGIEQAMNDRKIVLRMDAQTVHVTQSRYNSVRNNQYLDQNGDPIPGAVSTPNHNDKNRADLAGIISGNLKAESLADNAVQILRILRDEDPQPIVLVNFQGHPIMATSGSKTVATADAIGILRDALAEELGCKPMYFTGASGNVQIRGSSSYYEWGRNLAGEIVERIEETGWTDVIGDTSGGVAAVTRTCYYRAMVNAAPAWLRVTNPAFAGLSDAELVQKMLTRAEQIWGGSGYIGSYKASDLNEYGLYSKYHAKHYSGRKDVKPGDTKMLTISALSFGNVGFAVAPYEMYDTNGVEIREGSPFDITFVATMAGMPDTQSRSLSNGYIPSQLGYNNGGYSVDISRYAPGTGEDLRNDFLSMLHSMKGQ